MIKSEMMHSKNKLNETHRGSPSFEKMAEIALAATETSFNGSGIPTLLDIVFNMRKQYLWHIGSGT